MINEQFYLKEKILELIGDKKTSANAIFKDYLWWDDILELL